MRARLLRYLVLFAALLAIPASSFAGVFVSVNVAPPVLPVYEQPYCPGDGYIWTPGYWAWDPNVGDYYWVPGAWVPAPYTGALWTPGYWGWGDGAYLWHTGYWGLHIGFYGGVNYGYGYFGRGYEGGYWNHGAFTYNRAINRIDTGRIHNVYDHPVQHNDNRVSFNGGNGGVRAEASPGERVAEHEQHMNAVPLQQQHERAAMGNRAQFNSVNHGNPAVTATQRPGAQAFHQALAHPNNAEAVQAARNAPRSNNVQGNNAGHFNAPNNTQNRAQNAPQNNARSVNNNVNHAAAQPQQHVNNQTQQRSFGNEARPQGNNAQPRNFGGESHAAPAQHAAPAAPQVHQAPAAAPHPAGGGGGFGGGAPHPAGGGGGGAPHGGGAPAGGGGEHGGHR